ncbi:intracellular chloride channel [Aureococcus anophagefferens]|nr:intracellular chloride channel [Aureococcus anophagefferens]
MDLLKGLVGDPAKIGEGLTSYGSDLKTSIGTEGDWDVVMVLPVTPSDEESKEEDVENANRKFFEATIEKLAGDEIYVKIRSPEDRLEGQADVRDVPMLMDPSKLEKALAAGFPELQIAPIDIGTDCDGQAVSRFAPSQHIYCKYDRHPSLLPLYSHPANATSPFRSMQRIKLVTDIIQTLHRFGGCEISVGKEINDGKMLAFIQMPFDEYKDYFGEQAALYMASLGHATTYTAWLGALGLVATTIIQVIGFDSKPAAYCRAIFGVALFVWLAAYHDGWRKTEQTYALKWGMTEFEEEEPERPQYQGHIVKSPIDGKPAVYFLPKERAPAVAKGVLATLGMILLNLGFMLLMVVFKKQGHFTRTYSSMPATLANAIGIQVFTFVFKDIASHVSPPDGFGSNWACLENNCLWDLLFNLYIIFAANLVVSAGVSFVLPILQIKFNEYNEGGMDEAMTKAEWEYMLVEYDETLDMIENYMIATVQYGYIALFSLAAPATAFIGFLSNMVTLRLNGYKYLTGFRRIEPRGAQDIGVFDSIYTFINFAAGYGPSNRANIFMLIVAFFALGLILGQIIANDDEPDVALQVLRQDFIKSKIVDKIADEDEAITIDKKAPVFDITKKDDGPYFTHLAEVLGEVPEASLPAPAKAADLA